MASLHGNQDKQRGLQELVGLGQLLSGLAELPQIVREMKSQAKELHDLRERIDELLNKACGSSVDGWMDAKRVAAYLGISMGTFDKFRYLTSPSLKGYKVGGKIYYQRIDLDNYFKLYEVRSRNLG